MSRNIIFISPGHFVDRHAFTLAVHRITFGCLQTHHVRLVFRTIRYITIHNLISHIIFPVRRVIIISHHCPYPFRIHISIGIFPTFLQQQDSCRIIFSGHIRNLTETGSTNTILPVRHLHLVIKLKSNRFFCKRNTRLQHFLRIFSALNRLMHRTGKDRPCRQHCNINQSQHFHTFHACIQTGTVSISPLLRKDRSISFRNTGHFRHHIRSSPRRSAHILINLIPLDH